jgi:mRNA interferase MazF
MSPRRGEVWWVNLDPSVGSEQAKTRPVVVLSADGLGRLPLRIVVPCTDWKAQYEGYPWFIRLLAQASNGLQKDSGAFQVRSLSLQRFARRAGRLNDELLGEIAAAIALCVDYEG